MGRLGSVGSTDGAEEKEDASKKKKRGSFLVRNSPFAASSKNVAGTAAATAGEQEAAEPSQEIAEKPTMQPLGTTAAGVLAEPRKDKEKVMTKKEAHKQAMKQKERRPSQQIASDPHSMYL